MSISASSVSDDVPLVAAAVSSSSCKHYDCPCEVFFEEIQSVNWECPCCHHNKGWHRRISSSNSSSSSNESTPLSLRDSQIVGSVGLGSRLARVFRVITSCFLRPLTAPPSSLNSICVSLVIGFSSYHQKLPVVRPSTTKSSTT